jgi:hypothetical protein
MCDRIDLIPGTKGSGKSALYRVFVDFLPDVLLRQRKVVVAHGVQHHGDQVFLAYKEYFDHLSEDDFVSFWCIYLVSLAHEQFVKDARFNAYLSDCSSEIAEFRSACERARIPEIKASLSLKQIIGWALAILKSWRPSLKYQLPENAGEVTLDLFGNVVEDCRAPSAEFDSPIPRYVAEVKQRLDEILRKADLSLWLMIDRLDEIFPRRSVVETRALRGLLRTFRVFDGPRIRIKVFLRDDILEQIVASGQGFTALTHVTTRQADTLRWSEDQILTMIVKRLFAHAPLRNYLSIDPERVNASRDHQKEAFYKVFPAKVHTGARQSSTLQWIYTHTQDGRGVVTPRDVIDLLTRARQKQQDEFQSDPTGEVLWTIGPAAIQYGLSELSRRKRTTLLEAEFPHLWPAIQKLVGGKTEYTEAALARVWGSKGNIAARIRDDLISIGVLSRSTSHGNVTYKVPFLFREGLELTQGRSG